VYHRPFPFCVCPWHLPVGFLFNPQPDTVFKRSAPWLETSPRPRTLRAMPKNDPSARLSLPRTPLGTVTNAARLSSPASKPKVASATPAASQLDTRLSSLCAILHGDACAEVLALLKDSEGLSTVQTSLLRAGLRTLLDNQRPQGPLPARFRSNEGPVERLLTHVLSKCGDSFGELLEPACALLCRQPELALTESFKSIALHGHPAVAEGALQLA
jgi:hypothetical protein